MGTNKSEAGLSPIPRYYFDEASYSGGEEIVREYFTWQVARITTDNPVIHLAREACWDITVPKLPARNKVMLVASLLYFLAPIDTVPDVI